MIVNAYLNVTPKQWEEIKEKYVEPNMYHIVSNSKRKNKRCDDCGAYRPCSPYEGYCCDVRCLVGGNDTCDGWHYDRNGGIGYQRTVTLTDEEIDCFNAYLESEEIDIAFGNSDWCSIYHKIVGNKVSDYARDKMDKYF